MYGAIIGDIVGSRFEFDRGPWTKEFELFTEESRFTDDSVMTVAIAEALINAGKDADAQTIRQECIRSMKKWGQKYPDAGYGGKFYRWVLSDNPEPYNSFGNGSAMRVSSVGWIYDTVERTREVARATAEVTHNHPEGIKGAECTAAVIFLARNCWSKDEIREYVVEKFGYNLTKTVDEVRPLHRMDATCMDAMPKALISFFEGTSYEDVIRNAVSLGGDTDTIAAIAGAMAEAFFDMEIIFRGECQRRVGDDMREVLTAFDKFIGRTKENEEDEYSANAYMNAAYSLFITEKDKEKRYGAFSTYMDFMMKRVLEDGLVPAPFADVNNSFMQNLDPTKTKLGDTITIEECARLKLDVMEDTNGKKWIPLFFNNAQLSKGETSNIIMPVRLLDILNMGLNSDDVEGVVINPFGGAFVLTKDILKVFLDACEKNVKQNNTK